MTSYLYRVWLIAPDERKDSLNDFIKEEFDSSDWLLVPLSEDGTAPATHYMCCFSATHDQTSTWAERLTSEGGVPLPAGFSQFSPDQRIAFMKGASAALKNLTGVIVRVCRNDVMPWVLSVDQILEEEGLKLVSGGN